MNEQLEKAIKARDEFLKEHPHLIPAQQEIDELLDKCRDEDRLSVITMLMMKNMLELQKETNKLEGLTK